MERKHWQWTTITCGTYLLVNYEFFQTNTLVNFIHFNRMTMSQTDLALLWFNREGQEAPYGQKGDAESQTSYSMGECSYFLSFDNGACHHERTFVII